MEIPLTPAALLRTLEGSASALNALPRVLADLATSVEALARAGTRADEVAADVAALVARSRAVVEETSGPVQRFSASMEAMADALPPERARAVAQRLEPQVESVDTMLSTLEGPVARLGPVLQQLSERLDQDAVGRLADLVTQERVDRLLGLLEQPPVDGARLVALLEAAEAVLPRVPALLDAVLPVLDEVLPRLPAVLAIVQEQLLVEDGVLLMPDKLGAMEGHTGQMRADLAHVRSQLDDRLPTLENMGAIIEGLPGAGFARRRAASADD